MEQKRLNKLIFLFLPLFLGTILYLIYVRSTGFAEPEVYSIAYHIQTVVNFYIYLWSCNRVDRWLQQDKYKLKDLEIKALILILGFLLFLQFVTL